MSEQISLEMSERRVKTGCQVTIGTASYWQLQKQDTQNKQNTLYKKPLHVKNTATFFGTNESITARYPMQERKNHDILET